QLKKASDLKKEDYGFFFASAGHAALYDYPKAKALQAIATDVWDRGGVVGTVCHGPAILPGIIDSKTGKSIIHGKTVTGFTIEGELIFEMLNKLRTDGVVPSLTPSPRLERSTADRWAPSMITRSLQAAL